jgi:hypothetical protein
MTELRWAFLIVLICYSVTFSALSVGPVQFLVAFGVLYWSLWLLTSLFLAVFKYFGWFKVEKVVFRPAKRVATLNYRYLWGRFR